MKQTKMHRIQPLQKDSSFKELQPILLVSAVTFRVFLLGFLVRALKRHDIIRLSFLSESNKKALSYISCDSVGDFTISGTGHHPLNA